jgi:cell division protein FtsB
MGDLGQWGPLFAALAIVAAGMAGYTKWLDTRTASIRTELRADTQADINELKATVQKLETRVTELENGQVKARQLLVDAIMQFPEAKCVDKIREAMAVLH